MSCPKCGSTEKELYSKSGAISGVKWICKNCGTIYLDKSSNQPSKIAGRLISTIFLIIGLLLFFIAIIRLV